MQFFLSTYTSFIDQLSLLRDFLPGRRHCEDQLVQHSFFPRTSKQQISRASHQQQNDELRSQNSTADFDVLPQPILVINKQECEQGGKQQEHVIFRADEVSKNKNKKSLQKTAAEENNIQKTGGEKTSSEKVGLKKIGLRILLLRSMQNKSIFNWLNLLKQKKQTVQQKLQLLLQKLSTTSGPLVIKLLTNKLLPTKQLTGSAGLTPVYVQNLPTPACNFWSEFAHNLINTFLAVLMLGAVVIPIIFYAPNFYARFINNQVETDTQLIIGDQQETKPNGASETNDSSEGESQAGAPGKPEQNETNSQDPVSQKPVERYLPEQRENLPKGDWLIIPLIGVNTQLQRTAEPEQALETGVWWVPDFGLPGDLEKPMIVSGHRYGWKWWWKSDYWRYHSFYRLPELKMGDVIEIISDQRKWVYQIYDGEEGTEITDYQADLILYTCKHLYSPQRIFRYARLIKE